VDILVGDAYLSPASSLPSHPKKQTTANRRHHLESPLQRLGNTVVRQPQKETTMVNLEKLREKVLRKML
jgi:hypothetical protein